ncbi:MAG TPA: Fur family transcriptional regulator [Gemmatimonadales bacterium]|jgi:Fur family transcriptional regulator, ferric uptake regulator|nr:Fur family transcriptional regulator [Gemmatimonadales bacterium]
MARLARGEAAALLERFRRHLRDHHLPVTRQRDLVAQTVLTSDEHLSVEAIQRRLKDQGEHVGTATIYRTLDVLVRSGLIRAHDFGEGFKRYEPMPQQAHHEHLICLRCGKVVEFQNDRLERMIPIIADEHAFQHQRHRVEVYGLCRECRRRDLGPLAEDGA